MKRIKLLVFLLLITIALSFAGENYMYYLNSFACNYQYIDVKVNSSQEDVFIDTFEKKFRQEGIGVFTIDEKQISLFETRIDIYGNEEGLEAVKNSQVQEQSYSSLFSGKATVSFHDFSDLDDVEDRTYYLIGDDVDKMREIILSMGYESTLPKFSVEKDSSRMQICGVWAVVALIMLFFSIYDVLKMKKEYLLRKLMGQDKDIVIKNILIDSLVMLLSFTAAKLLLGMFTNTGFYSGISIAFVLMIVALNAASYLILIKTDMRKVFANASLSEGVLVFSYVLKIAVIIVLFAVISSNLILVKQGLNIYSQKDYFKSISDYSLVNLTSASEDFDVWDKETSELNEAFYIKYMEDYNGIALYGMDYNEYNVLGMLADYRYDAVIANKGAKSILSSAFDNELDIGNRPLMIVPEKYEGDEEYVEFWKEALDFEEINCDVNDIEMVYHSSSNNITVLDSDNNELPSYSLNVAEVAVIYIPQNDIIKKGSLKWAFYNCGVFYQFSEEELDEIKETYQENAKIEITGAEELYRNKWNSAKKELYMAFVMIFICLLLEVYVISNILSVEYEKNSRELVLKKLLGYTGFQRYRKIFLVSNISSVVAFGSALIIFANINGSQLGYMCIIGVIVMAVENLLILRLIHIMESVKIQKVLKGGGL